MPGPYKEAERRLWALARFHVDIGIGDEVLEPLDVVEGRDWLAPAASRLRRFRRSLESSILDGPGG